MEDIYSSKAVLHKDAEGRSETGRKAVHTRSAGRVERGSKDWLVYHLKLIRESQNPAGLTRWKGGREGRDRTRRKKVHSLDTFSHGVQGKEEAGDSCTA